MKTLNDYPIIQINNGDSQYPSRLLDLKDAPESIYSRGNFDDDIFANCIAIVGSRTMTRYGRQVAEKWSEYFAMSGVTVVSGFMYGIDTVCHQATIANKGRTIAVFGCGISQIYPPDNDKLYTSILESKGLILSEYKPEQKPKPWMYAKRNRIVAALANLGVLVIEASVKSGSLITADFAIKLRRTVYAVPGPINSSASEGTNWLIKTGKAKLVTNPEEIIKNNKVKTKNNSTQLSPFKNTILELIKSEGTPLAMDELITLSGLSATEVSKQLTLLNLQGLIDEENGKYAAKN
jgi:DNA processing protein